MNYGLLCAEANQPFGLVPINGKHKMCRAEKGFCRACAALPSAGGLVRQLR